MLNQATYLELSRLHVMVFGIAKIRSNVCDKNIYYAKIEDLGYRSFAKQCSGIKKDFEMNKKIPKKKPKKLKLSFKNYKERSIPYLHHVFVRKR